MLTTTRSARPSMMPRPRRPISSSEPDHARFALFASALALATCVYHAQSSSWLRLDLHPLALAATIAVLAKPSSVGRFLLFVLIQTAAIYAAAPWINTNRMALLLVGITILCAAAHLMCHARSRRIQGGELLAAFEPPLRVLVLVLYFFAFWHKLNVGYLAPDTSCAVHLYNLLVELAWFLPLPAAQSVAMAVIYGSLAIEGGLPVLLLIRRTRTAAIVLGLVFHFVLGLSGFMGFSATMCALLLLFAPSNFSATAREWWTRLASRPWSLSRRQCVRLVRIVPGVLIVPAAVIGGAMVWNPEWLASAMDWSDTLKRVVWYGWWLYLIPIAVFVLIIRQRPGSHVDSRRLLVGRYPLLLAIGLLAVFNGMCPYLGLKTESCFAMYSNLRTEGGQSNHLIIRRPVALADYQTDLVQVLDSSDESLRKMALKSRQVPFFALRREVSEYAASGRKNLELTYVRGGETFSLRHAELDPELAAPLSYLERKFVRFRKIPTGCNACAH